MKKWTALILLVVPVLVLASSGHAEEGRYFAQTGRENDFIPRVVNFTIFASLLYYLISNPIKNFFKERKESIAAQLQEIEEKLQSAKHEEREAKVRLEESKKKAEQIIADAKKEAKLLAEKISQANENELSIMKKQLEEKMALEERKSAREVIEEVLSQNIITDDILINENKVVEIISKKVA